MFANVCPNLPDVEFTRLYPYENFLYVYENINTKCRDVCDSHISSFLLDNVSHMALG